MHKETQLKIIYFLGIAIFILFAIYAYFSNVKDYINDSIILIILLSLIYLLRKYLDFTQSIFILLIIGFISHNLGVFGFYNVSPIPIQYDHITHFIGLFAVSTLFFNFFKKYFSDNKINNVLILIIIILATLGVGSLIETAEFLGFLKFGFGEGFLKFGGLGDTPLTEEVLRDIDLIGGGWVNTMWDLVYNALGALFGVTFMYILYLYKNKNDKRFKAL